MKDTLRAAIFTLGMVGAAAADNYSAIAEESQQQSSQPPAPSAAFQKMKEACQADETRLCSSYVAQDGQRPSPELGRCMKQNYANLSVACQEAMNQARPPRPPGGDRRPASGPGSSAAGAI